MDTRREFIVDTVGVVAAMALVGSCRGPDTTGEVVPTMSPEPESSDPSTTTSLTPTASSAPTSSEPELSPWSGADFAELDAFLDAADTEAFQIVEQGQVVHEWYRTDASYGRDVASAQKSVLSLLVGRAIADGLFDLDTHIDDVLGVGWTPHGQSAGITVRQLLSMTSGLDDQSAVIAPPGTMWRYGGAFAAAIGQTVLDHAQPGLPDVWLDESLATSQPYNGAHGYLWWLNGKDSFLLPGRAMVARPGPLVPSAPAGMVAALGKDDQKLYLVADLGLAIARLGGKAVIGTQLARSSFDDDLWQLLSQMRPT